MDNMTIYNQARSVPDEAQKQIAAGRLKGMTDINPMWRIKRLTEIFGPCGLGWWYEIKDKHILDDPVTKQSAAIVDIDLYYRWNGEVSQPIPGTGGAAFVSQERNGPYMSDECYKMALTDALSVAAKALGILRLRHHRAAGAIPQRDIQGHQPHERALPRLPLPPGGDQQRGGDRHQRRAHRDGQISRREGQRHHHRYHRGCGQRGQLHRIHRR